MAAPSGTNWGTIYGGKGRLGIYTSATHSYTTTTVNVQVWLWTKYSCYDTSNVLYYDVGKSVSSATSSAGSVSINHTVSSGNGWSTSNQTKILDRTYDMYPRGTSAVSYNVYAKLTGIEYVGTTLYTNTTYTIPALDSYTVSYNANGGSGAPSSQTKYYGKTLTLSSTKPTRTGYSFVGWSTSASATSATWSAGDNYTTNASDVLYAVWKANTYTVSYNANGGNSAPSSQIKTYGVTLKLSSDSPTRSNYNFKGWGTSASSTSVAYAAGANYTSNASITLYAIWELAYVKPRIINLSVTRCDSSGNNTNDGKNALVSFEWECDEEGVWIAIAWKLSSDTTWSSPVTVSATGTSGEVSQIVGLTDTLDVDHGYDIRVTVGDNGGSTLQIKTLPSTLYYLDFLKGGKGVAIGKAAEKSDRLDVYWTSRFDNPIMTGQKNGFKDGKEGTYISEDGIIHLQRTYTEGDTESGDPYLAFSIDSEKEYSGRISLTHDTKNMWFDKANDYYIRPASAGTSISYRPYYRKGDTVNVYIWTGGYVSSSSSHVYISIPLSKPIIGNPTVTITSTNGVILRQNGNYTHGSSASVGVTPSSLTGSINGNGSFIRLDIAFSATTNAINNAPVGVSFSGTITFS